MDRRLYARPAFVIPLLVVGSIGVYTIVVGWPAVSSVIEAMAASAVAWFTWVQVRRDGMRLDGERAAAIAKVQGHAFLLRQKLREFVGNEADQAEAFRQWFNRMTAGGRLYPELLITEGLAHEMRASAVGAPADVQQAVDSIFVFVMAASRRLKRYCMRPNGSAIDLFDWHQILSDARDDVVDAIGLLENHQILGNLTSIDQELDRKRRDEDPWLQLTRAIMEEGARQHALETGVSPSEPDPTSPKA